MQLRGEVNAGAQKDALRPRLLRGSRRSLLKILPSIPNRKSLGKVSLSYTSAHLRPVCKRVFTSSPSYCALRVISPFAWNTAGYSNQVLSTYNRCSTPLHNTHNLSNDQLEANYIHNQTNHHALPRAYARDDRLPHQCYPRRAHRAPDCRHRQVSDSRLTALWSVLHDRT